MSPQNRHPRGQKQQRQVPRRPAWRRWLRGLASTPSAGAARPSSSPGPEVAAPSCRLLRGRLPSCLSSPLASSEPLARGEKMPCSRHCVLPGPHKRHRPLKVSMHVCRRQQYVAPATRTGPPRRPPGGRRGRPGLAPGTAEPPSPAPFLRGPLCPSRPRPSELGRLSQS